MKGKAKFWVGALGAVIVLGCGGSGTTVTTVPDPVVRFINASPNSTALDCFVDDTQIANNVPYLGSSANFQSFDPALYDISCNEDADLETQVIETSQFNADQNLLSVAVGLVTPPNDDLDKRMRVTTFGFDRSRPNADKARLVIVHGFVRSAGNQTPNIDFRNPGDNPRVSITNIEFGGSRGFLIDSGPQTFEVRRASTEFVIVPAASFNFQPGRIYAAIVCGVEGTTGTTVPQIRYIELQTK